MAEQKSKKRDSSKLKENVSKGLKISAKVLIAIIEIVVPLVFIVVPFLHNQIDSVIAKYIWYPACIIFAVSAISMVFKKPQTPLKYPIFDFLGNLSIVPIAIIFGSAFLINYYNTAYNWWWAIFVLVIIYVPVLVFGLHGFLKKEKQYTEEQSRNSLKNSCKYISFYCLMDLFYMAIFNYWMANEQWQALWLVLQFIFGGIGMVFIFYNLTKAFLSNNQKRWWSLIQDFIWGIAITIYLIYLVPDEDSQSIILTIIAAVYGGLLTLVGVAWTIKVTNEKHKEDLIRVENERKEETRKKHIPYVRISFDDKKRAPMVVNAYITKGLDFNSAEDLALLKNKVYFLINIKNFDIKNISSKNIIIKGVFVHGKFYKFSAERIIEANECCEIRTTNNCWISVAHPENKIVLIVSDIIGNLYKIDCCVSHDIETSYHQIASVGDEEYTGFQYSYEVTSIDLPILISDKQNEALVMT
ncbi:MAG: APC family permease [Clostridia bacterium]|nr:APC family permease [Clostridia bacterium]